MPLERWSGCLGRFLEAQADSRASSEVVRSGSTPWAATVLSGGDGTIILNSAKRMSSRSRGRWPITLHSRSLAPAIPRFVHLKRLLYQKHSRG
jgi:hypothetical protein